MKRHTLGLVLLAGLCACSSPQVEGGIAGKSGSGQGGGGGKAGGGGSTSGAGGDDGPILVFPDGGPGSGGAGGGPADANGMICGVDQHQLQRLPPEILLVLDRSTTMGFSVEGSTNSRWVELGQAVDQVVMQTQGNVVWGLKMFPTVSGCAVADPMEVPAALNNHMAMAAAMMGTSPNRGRPGTPMQLALRKATQHLMGRNTPNGKYLVIGTDGLPNCAGGLPTQDDTQGVVAAIAQARMAGIKTFVVGIATHDEGAQAQAALDMMAEAGGEARPASPKFFAVNNRQDLVTALNQITTRIASCSFPLSKTPPNPDEVHVKVGGKIVKKDPADGWSFAVGMSAIVLNGAACEQIKQANPGTEPDVQIIFGCPGLVFE